MRCVKCATELPPQQGRGRPRKYCDEHRSINLARNYVPVDYPVKSCAECGSDFKPKTAKSQFCSTRCRNATRDRNRMFPCSECSKPMWQSSDVADKPTCLACRRAKMPPPLDPVQRWDCIECGVPCERPRVKGQRPAFCTDCRSHRKHWITVAERRAIYERDGWMCWLCEDPVDASLIGTRSEWRPSLDHVIPRSKGGGSTHDNLKLAHFWCNVVRGDDRCPPEVFRASA